VTLFYYSGHGAQQSSPPEFWHLEPDRLDETLVCWDSRTEGSWDLADKELAQLIAEVAAKNPYILVILDCCHSGSGTRTLLQETAVRRIPTDRRPRPLDTYIVTPHMLDNAPTSRGASGWFHLPQGRHILLAACRDSEEAKEYHADGKTWGTFSYFLRKTLEQMNSRLTYRDLLARTRALVRSNVAAQSPQLEATEVADFDQPFLGGAIAERLPYFLVRHDDTNGWLMEGGAIHGIPRPADMETTTLALFPFAAEAEQLRALPAALGQASVVEVLPQYSKVKIEGVKDLHLTNHFKAVVTKLPLPPLPVRLEGDTEGVRLAREALASIGPNQTPSLYVGEVKENDEGERKEGDQSKIHEAPQFRLLARDGEYVLTRPSDDRPLVAQIRGYTLTAAKLYERYTKIWSYAVAGPA
jgi:hypothetical protein